MFSAMDSDSVVIGHLGRIRFSQFDRSQALVIVE